MGEIVELRSAGARARLAPAAGGRVTALQLESSGGMAVDVLHPYPEDFFDPIRWAKGGIYPLLPYSNRIADAQLRVHHETVSLQAHPDAAPHTLHGNAHLQPWQLAESDASSAVMTLDCAAGPAWPWRYSGRMEVRLTPSELSVRIEIRNTSSRAMPAGIGLHPYFRHQADAPIGYQASTVWPATADFLAGPPRPAQAHDTQEPARPLRAGGMTDYLGGWTGTADVGLPGGACLRMSAEPVFGHLVVHRPDNLAYVCLEPVSHVADGFNLAARGVGNTGTRWLGPDDTLGGTVRFALVEKNP